MRLEVFVNTEHVLFIRWHWFKFCERRGSRTSRILNDWKAESAT